MEQIRHYYGYPSFAALKRKKNNKNEARFLGTNLKIYFQAFITQLQKLQNQSYHNNVLYEPFYYVSDDISDLFYK